MKKHWLRILTVVLMVCLGVAVFAACGGGKEDDADTTYTLTYDLNGGTGTAPQGGSYKKGETVTVATGAGLSKADSTFEGWLDGTQKVQAGSSFTMPARNVTLKADWKESAPADPIEGVWTFSGAELTAADITSLKIAVDLVEGESFAGYAVVDMVTEKHLLTAVKLTEAEGVYSGEQGDFTLSVKLTADNKLAATLHDELNVTTATKAALPGALAITGTYYVAEADWELDFTAKKLKVEGTETAATFTPVADYIVLELTDEEAAFVIFQEEGKYYVFLGDDVVELTLTATGTKQYTLKFYAEKDAYETPVDGGTITVLEGETISEAEGFSALNPTKQGMVFEGWYYMKDGTETAFDASGTPEDIITDGTELQIYAKWAYAIIGNPDNSAPWPGNDLSTAVNPYKGKIEKGNHYTYSGTQTSAAQNNWESIFTYIYSGDASNGYFRVDNWIQDGANAGMGAEVTEKEGWVITKESIGNYNREKIALSNGSFVLEIDWVDTSIIKIYIKVFSADKVDVAYFEEYYTIKAADTKTLKTEYNLAIACEKSYVKIWDIKTDETAVPFEPTTYPLQENFAVGDVNCAYGFTDAAPSWIGKSFAAGEKVTLNGTLKTAGDHGWEVPLAYLMSTKINYSSMRLDGFNNNGEKFANGEHVNVAVTPGITNADTNYNTADGKAGANDDTQFLGALKEGGVTFTLTYDRTDASKIVITAKFEKGEMTRTTVYTITAQDGHELAEKYWIGLGGENIYLQVGTIVYGSGSPATYAVTYELGDHAKAEAEAPTQDPVTSGTQITLAEAPEAATGYEFDGWYVGEDKIETETYKVTKAVTITAHWKPIEYTLTFDKNAPEGQESNIKGEANEIKVTLEDATKPLPNLSLEGYTFNGWKLKGEGEAAKSFTLTTGEIEKLQGGKQFSFTADWTKNAPDAVAIKFEAPDMDGGTKPSDTAHAPGEYTIPEEEPTRKGYTFKGWKVTADGDDKLYKHGGENQTYTVKEATPVTFTAEWEEITYTLKFYKEKGQEDAADHTVTVKGLAAVDSQLPEAPEKDYFTFGGWYLADNETEVDGAYKPSEQSATELKVYAKWTQVEALPSENQTPDDGNPIIGGNDTKNYSLEQITADGAQWIGKIKRGQKVVLSGAIESGAGANWDAPVAFLYSGLEAKGFFRSDWYIEDFNTEDDTAEGQNQWDTFAAYEHWALRKEAMPADWALFKKALARGTVTITWEWLNTNYIRLTIQLVGNTDGTHTTVYGISSADAAQYPLKDEYSIGIASVFSKWTITSKTDSAATALTDSTASAAPESLTLGDVGNGTGYTPKMQTYSIEKGHSVTFTGTMTAANANWNGLLVSIYEGDFQMGIMRPDNYIVDGGFANGMGVTATQHTTVEEDSWNWTKFCTIKANCTFTLTIDYKTENKVTVTMTFNAEETGNYTQTYTLTAVEGKTLQNKLSYDLGVDGAYVNFTTITAE